MILDERTEFFDALLIPQAAGTTVLGDVIDLSVPRDLGQGIPVFWTVTEDITAAGGTSIQLNLITSATSNMASPTVIASTPVILLAGLTAGKILYQAPLPAEGNLYQRYLGVQGVVAGTFTGTGAISSFLTLDSRSTKHYPQGVN